ncbi:MAG: cytochrome c oxidase subunit II [Acidobacteriota bacterium]
MQTLPMMPEQASTAASEVDALYIFLTALTVVFSILIAGAIVYFAVKYRRRSPQDLPRPIEGAIKLEIFWSVIPFIISMGIFAWSASIYFRQYRMPAEAMDIYVVGKQWMWKFQHIEGQREINELHVPLGRKVRLTMTTEDVIHSLYIPAFRVKMDVVPGKYTSLWFEATKAGRYHIFCAEYCGTNHSGMIGWIEVMEPPDYQAWLAGGAQQGSLADAGEKLFQSLACANCHRSDEAGKGPALDDLFGSVVALQGGQTVTADVEYIRESILNPQAKIVAGFPRASAPASMPTFQGLVTEEQLLQLIEYIRSLKTKQAAPAQSQPTAPQKSEPPKPQK